MLDEIFKLMYEDDYSKWSIRSRLACNNSHLELEVPHHFMDGRTFVSYFLPILSQNALDLKSSLRGLDSNSISVKLTRDNKLTKFQQILQYFINFKIITESDKSIALAVDLSQVSHVNTKGLKNKVSFPLFIIMNLLTI